MIDFPTWSIEVNRPPPKRARVWASRTFGRAKDAFTCRLADLLGADGGAWLMNTGAIRTRQRLPFLNKLLDSMMSRPTWIKIHTWPWCRLTQWDAGHVDEGGWKVIHFVVGRGDAPLWPCPLVFGGQQCGVRAKPGDACDKTFETCRDKYHNEARFQGMTDSGLGVTLRPGTHDVREPCSLEVAGVWVDVHALRVTIGPAHATWVATVRGVTLDVPVPSIVHVLGGFGFLSGTVSTVDKRLGRDGLPTVKLYASCGK